jgi:hypothetical protein
MVKDEYVDLLLIDHMGHLVVVYEILFYFCVVLPAVLGVAHMFPHEKCSISFW